MCVKGAEDQRLMRWTTVSHFPQEDLPMRILSRLSDIVTANFGIDFGFSNEISVLLRNGDGTFQPDVEYEAGDFPKSVAVGDFKGDGKLDVVVANFELADAANKALCCNCQTYAHF